MFGDIENYMYFKKYFGAFQLNSFPGGFICYAMSIHPLSIPCIPRQKNLKNINMKRDIGLCSFKIFIEMRGKCKFQMALSCLKIDYFEKLWGDRELHVLRKYFWSMSIKFVPLGGGVHLPYHVTSPIIYSKHLQTIIC